MNCKRILLFFGLVFLSFAFIHAQDREIQGRVLDENGAGMPGVNVFAEGAKNIATLSDLDGNFRLKLPAGINTLIFSYIGYTEKKINIEGLSTVEVKMEVNAQLIDQVVVTALGIKREEKAIGYAVEQVSGDAMENTAKTNPIAALSGKVAGLSVSASGSGAGGSTKVLIRGTSSITGSNEPLYVIDGVPIDNTGGSSGTQYGGFDYGNGANNINPDDIETISVLKGGAATALYGSRGSNGVIMITTKKGSNQGGVGIDFSSSVSFDQALIKPDFQNIYSQGAGAKFLSTSFRSWGEKMNGQIVTNFRNEEQTLGEITIHPYDDFFNLGVNYDNTLTINKRGENYGLYFSANILKNKGIQPGNVYNKQNLTLRYDAKLSNFITFDAKANYINQAAVNRPNLSGSPNNPVYLLALMPRSVSLNQLYPYMTTDGYPVVWTEQYEVNEDGTIRWRNQAPTFASSPLLQNPYWATEYNHNEDERHRLIGFGEFNLDFKKWLNLPFELSLNTRVGLDYYTDTREIYNTQNTYFKANGLATLNSNKSDALEMNYTSMLKFGKSFDNFSFYGSLGANLQKNRSNGLYASSESGLINLDGKYVIQNFNNPIVNEGISQREVQSVFGLMSFDYKKMAYLDVTFRNDWSSNLAPENWSYFYPSVSTSWLLHETFKLPQLINFLKLRGSWAETGSSGNYSAFRYFQYGTNPSQYLGLPYGSIPGIRPNPDLKAELSVSKELGFNIIMFSSRFTLDLSYYQQGTKNQILLSPLPPSSGYTQGYINGGFINNTGIELSTSFEVLKFQNLSWKIGGNFTRQWSKVEELGEEMDLQILGGGAGVVTAAKINEPVGIMMGSAFDRDELGRLILDAENLPTYKKTEEGAIDYEQIIGNSFPTILWGFNSNLNYRNLIFSFEFDSKLGHDIFSLTNLRGAEYGTLAYTMEGRDEWEKAKEISVITGVPPADGFMVDGVKDGIEGSYPVDPQKYWDRMTRIYEAFVYDASYIRLRKISLSWNVTGNFIKALSIKQLSLTIFANNVIYIMKRTKNISPESSFGTGNSVGIEMFSQPELRNFGLNLKVSF